MHNFRYIPIVSLTLLLLVGCNTTSFFHAPARFMFSRKQTDKVARILCLWEAAEGQGLDGKPSRGFAGQILFFTYGEPSPVPVKGTVKIYEYDAFVSEHHDPEPVHTFIFDNGGWNAHVTEGTLGYSYNVFLPYVVSNPGKANCGLRVEFIPDNGPSLSSPYTSIQLTSKHELQAEMAIRRDIVSNSASKPVAPPTTAATPASGPPAAAVPDKPAAGKLDSLTIELPRPPRRNAPAR